MLKNASINGLWPLLIGRAFHGCSLPVSRCFGRQSIRIPFSLPTCICVGKQRKAASRALLAGAPEQQRSHAIFGGALRAVASLSISSTSNSSSSGSTDSCNSDATMGSGKSDHFVTLTIVCSAPRLKWASADKEAKLGFEPPASAVRRERQIYA